MQEKASKKLLYIGKDGQQFNLREVAGMKNVSVSTTQIYYSQEETSEIICPHMKLGSLQLES